MRRSPPFVLAVLLLPAAARAADPWPGDASSTDIDADLLSVFPDIEPIGVVWHPGRGTFIVVGDVGEIAELTPDGTVLGSWDTGHGFEGVTVVDAAGSIIYAVGEYSCKIRAFDLDAGDFTGDVWDLSAYITPETNQGPEALTWVPDLFAWPAAASARCPGTKCTCGTPAWRRGITI